MKNMKKIVVIAGAMIVGGLGTSQAWAGCGSDHSAAAGKRTIVETAVAAGSFETLAGALQAADLVETLQGPGPFTVFAPTDDAFSQLPAGTLRSLLKPANKQRLTSILTYHVTSGRLGSQLVADASAVATLNGQRLDIETRGERVRIDGANVIKTDIECTNGVIHVIDAVMLPSSSNILETAQSAGMFTTLATAITAVGLEGALAGDGPFTVFAPTDEAFAKLPEGTVQSLLQPQNRAQLQAILKYHVVAGRVFSDQAVMTRSAETLQGEALNIRFRNGRVMINDAAVVQGDIDAANGVIHVIDAVLMPETSAAAAPRTARQLLELAIERGAPQYNHGNAQACADMYEITIAALLANPAAQISDAGRQRLTRALSEARSSQSARSKAWALRYAIDDVLLNPSTMLSATQ